MARPLAKSRNHKRRGLKMVNQAQIPDLANLKRVAEAAENTFAELCKSGGDELAEAWDKAELEFMDVANSTAVLALISEIQALRKEADRYRWLRDKSESGHSFYLSVPLWLSGIRFRKEDVDAGIDTAMGSGEPS
nr:MAG TPA: Ead/Ea22-like protein [Caudoviricetes sp.]